jgi:lipopolysaccharide/colanic/teichoic acid biosynthesis glycosyltransferase
MGKRVIDVCLILLAAPIVVPLIALLAVLVMRDGKSAFYTQSRIGLDGSYYKIWKLRTMVANADELLSAYLASDPEAAEEWTSTQKLKNDPRITPLGRILRKTSMDELPQLWNVFVGEMSLVGPRPMLPEQQAMYPGRAYYTQRPGITGTWQISKRNECSFSDRARFDSDYISNISLLQDFKVLLATVRVVVKGTGY